MVVMVVVGEELGYIRLLKLRSSARKDRYEQ